jgi:hypothetical protein
MVDIYEDSNFSYSISPEDRIRILNQLSEEFDIEFKISQDSIPQITFSDDCLKKKYDYHSLWGSKPPLSNIRYVYKQFMKHYDPNINDDYLNAEFDKSETGKLCQEIHSKSILLSAKMNFENMESENPKMNKEERPVPVMVRRDLWRFMNLDCFNFEAGEEFERTRNIAYYSATQKLYRISNNFFHHAYCASKTFVTKFLLAYVAVFCTKNEDKTVKLDDSLKDLFAEDLIELKLDSDKIKFNDIPRLIVGKTYPMPERVIVDGDSKPFYYEPIWMYTEESKSLEDFFSEMRKNPSVDKWHERLNQ